MLPPPDSVTVGPYRLAITVDQAAIDSESVAQSRQLSGFYNGVQGRIVLMPDQVPDSMAEVLLHEILHAVCEVAGKPLDDETEERAVSAIAPTLLDTLRRNPDVTAWLLG